MCYAEQQLDIHTPNKPETTSNNSNNRKYAESPAQKQQSAMKPEVVRKGQNYKLYLDFVGSTWFTPLSFHVIQFILLGQGSSPSNRLQTANPRCQIQSEMPVQLKLLWLI